MLRPLSAISVPQATVPIWIAYQPAGVFIPRTPPSGSCDEARLGTYVPSRWRRHPLG